MRPFAVCRRIAYAQVASLTLPSRHGRTDELRWPKLRASLTPGGVAAESVSGISWEAAAPATTRPRAYGPVRRGPVPLCPLIAFRTAESRGHWNPALAICFCCASVGSVALAAESENDVVQARVNSPVVLEPWMVPAGITS
jgi:hypothetical protein